MAVFYSPQESNLTAVSQACTIALYQSPAHPLSFKQQIILYGAHTPNKHWINFVTFDQFKLDSRVQAGIKQMGFTEPTPIQEKAIPVALNGRDVLGLAQTGTGKTAAFLLPVINQLCEGPLNKVRALIIAPTRELADQIQEQAVSFSRKTRIRSVAIYGGVGKKPQIDALKRGVEIVVACPGRLLDLHASRLINLSNVEHLVLDEADRMFDMGFLPDIRRIIKLLPNKRQNLLFSATMPNDIRQLADETLNDPETVKIGMIAPAETVSHSIYPCTKEIKGKMLRALLPDLSFGRMLIFTRTKYKARNLARDLSKKGYNATALQGNMSQNQRVRAMEGFRKGKFDILIATDIAARGIDVSDITHVINFDMPDTVDAYTHRIGRTGRAAQSGEALTFVTAEDVATLRRVERVLKKEIETRSIPEFDYEGFDPTKPWPAPTNHKPQSSRNQNNGRANTSRKLARKQSGKPGSRRRRNPNRKQNS